MVVEQIQRTYGSDLMSLEAASERLDLTPSFLSWAIESGLLQAYRNATGDWCLPAGEIEKGLRAFQEEMESRKERLREGPPAALSDAAISEDKPPETEERQLQDFAPCADARTAAGEPSETDYLRALLENHQASLEAKDSLIADLARQMGKLGEAALARLPVPGRPDKN